MGTTYLVSTYVLLTNCIPPTSRIGARRSIPSVSNVQTMSVVVPVVLNIVKPLTLFTPKIKLVPPIGPAPRPYNLIPADLAIGR